MEQEFITAGRIVGAHGVKGEVKVLPQGIDATYLATFPTYYLDGTPIAQTIAIRLPYTLELSGYALLFSAIIGIGIGIVSAIRQNGVIDYIGRILAVVGQAVPQFLVGILLILIFAITWAGSPPQTVWTPMQPMPLWMLLCTCSCL